MGKLRLLRALVSLPVRQQRPPSSQCPGRPTGAGRARVLPAKGPTFFPPSPSKARSDWGPVYPRGGATKVLGWRPGPLSHPAAVSLERAMRPRGPTPTQRPTPAKRRRDPRARGTRSPHPGSPERRLLRVRPARSRAFAVRRFRDGKGVRDLPPS